jgi:hypothetical protein
MLYFAGKVHYNENEFKIMNEEKDWKRYFSTQLDKEFCD